ncbi:hypothetical protein ACH49O_19305 [Streptomyces coeruleorubidus]|uniref:hypothetical protein n=1 Tax=Streptomyces coeruleorubidus TaxID=116188 RepID=UPI0033C824E0
MLVVLRRRCHRAGEDLAGHLDERLCGRRERPTPPHQPDRPDREAAKYQVFPLDDRVTERENPAVAGRIDLLGDRASITYRAGMRRFTEETTLNVKNRSHSITADVDLPETTAEGVIIAQGGRFGGWTL